MLNTYLVYIFKGKWIINLFIITDYAMVSRIRLAHTKLTMASQTGPACFVTLLSGEVRTGQAGTSREGSYPSSRAIVVEHPIVNRLAKNCR